MKNINKWLFRFIGVFIFLLILTKINFHEVFDILYRIKLIFFFYALILFFLGFLLKSWRWSILLKHQNINCCLSELTCYYIISMFLGTLTPGRIGEFYKVKYLMDKGYQMGRASVSVILDRMYDILLLFIMLEIIFFYPFVNFKKICMPVLFGMGIVCIILFFLFWNPTAKNILKKVIKFILPKHVWTHFCSNINEFCQDVKHISTNKLIFPLIITILWFIIYLGCNYFVLLSVGVKMPIGLFIICISSIAVISFLPISISGIGTRDAILIYFFSLIGYTKESAIAYSIMILFFAYVVHGSLYLIALLFITTFSKS